MKKLASDAQELMSLYVAFLRALYNIHQNFHWRSKGDNFYGNHLLFQRLYEGTQEDADNAAERTIGLFDTLEGLDTVIATIVSKYSPEGFEGQLTQPALDAEQTFLAISEKLYQQLKESGDMTLGLDDLIMNIASRHEVHVYLLKQTMKHD